MRRSEARSATEPRSEIDLRSPGAPLPVSMGGPGAGGDPARGSVQLAPGALRVPHDTVNEQILIAAACRLDRDRRRELLRDASADHFFGKGHKEFWAALRELDARGLEFALDTVRQLGGEKVDAAHFESILAARVDVPPNLRHHVDTLRWDAARIEAAQGSLADLMDQFRDPLTEPSVLAQTARRLAEEVAAASPQNGSHDPNALIAANRAAYEARRMVEPIWPYGIEGFEREPDGRWRVKPGMKPGKTTVITALSGHGKSILAKAIALGQTKIGEGRRGLFGAFEDEAGEVLEDLAGMSLGFERDEIDEGRLSPEDVARFFAEQERIAGFVRFMRRPPREGKKARTTIAGRIEWCFSEAVRVGASYLTLDLLARLFDTAKADEEQRGWEVFQRCAEESGVHGVATHQQRAGDVEQRSDKRPTREGLKGSKGVLEVADTLIGVYRPALVQTVDDKTLEVIVLKQRRGRWPFCVRFDFDPKRWLITKGREVAYLRPGEDGLDDIVDRQRGGGRSRS